MLYSLKIFEDTPVFIEEGAYSMGSGGKGGGSSFFGFHNGMFCILCFSQTSRK